MKPKLIVFSLYTFSGSEGSANVSICTFGDIYWRSHCCIVPRGNFATVFTVTTHHLLSTCHTKTHTKSVRVCTQVLILIQCRDNTNNINYLSQILSASWTSSLFCQSLTFSLFLQSHWRLVFILFTHQSDILEILFVVKRYRLKHWLYFVFLLLRV